MSVEETAAPAGTGRVDPVAATDRSVLRRAGWWTLTTGAAIASTPLFVFVIPWQLLYPETAGVSGTNPLVRDPAFTAQQPLQGVFIILFGLVFAVAIVAAAVNAGHRADPSRGLRGVPLGAAITAAALELAEVGMNGTMHSALQAGFGGTLTSVQPDAAVREMVGIALLFVTQGLAGTAGLAVLAWLLATTAGLRRAGLLGRAPFVVLAVYSAISLIPFIVGLAAAVLLLSMFALFFTGIVLLVAARRQGR